MSPTPHREPADDGLKERGARPCVFEAASPDRRAFVRGAAAALGALAALGLSGEEAMALPVRVVRGRRGRSGGKRYPMPTSDGVVFDDAEGIVIVRRGELAWALLATCPHKAVVKIKWQGDEHRFQCPKHESRYEVNGTFIEGKATRNLDRLPVRKDGRELVVDVDTVLESDKDASGWAAAAAHL